MSEEIRLVLPAEEDFHGIAHLVVGGIGARHELTFEQLEDFQVAIETLLGCREDEGDIVIQLRVDEVGIHAEVGPFSAHALDALEQGGESFGPRRVLETVCDTFEIEERDGGSWVQLQKRTKAAA